MSKSALDIGEGRSGEYTVSLGSVPAAPVTVTLESDNADVRVAPGALTFTHSGYGARTVTVSAAQDDENGETAPTVLKLTGSRGARTSTRWPRMAVPGSPARGGSGPSRSRSAG